MLDGSKAFSSFAVDDIDRARSFYGDTLGLGVSDIDMKGVTLLNLDVGQGVMVYPKPDHAPATFTVMHFRVEDIDAAVDELTGRGLAFEQVDGFGQDEKGISRGNPRNAWFRDPAGNILGLVQET